jgi:hypothetical protein
LLVEVFDKYIEDTHVIALECYALTLTRSVISSRAEVCRRNVKRSEVPTTKEDNYRDTPGS